MRFTFFDCRGGGCRRSGSSSESSLCWGGMVCGVCARFKVYCMAGSSPWTAGRMVLVFQFLVLRQLRKKITPSEEQDQHSALGARRQVLKAASKTTATNAGARLSLLYGVQCTPPAGTWMLDNRQSTTRRPAWRSAVLHVAVTSRSVSSGTDSIFLVLDS